MKVRTVLVLLVAQGCRAFDAAPSPGEATLDGGGSGGGPTADAGAGEAGDGTATTSVCTGELVFGDSFDQPLAMNGWAVVGKVQNDGFGLPSRSLSAATPAQSPGARSENVASRTIAVDGKKGICIELDAFVQTEPSSYSGAGYSEVVAISPDSSFVLYIEVRPAGMEIAGQELATPIDNYRFGSWQHLVIRLPFAQGARASVEVDGRTTQHPSELGAAPSTLKLELGLHSEGYGAGTTGPARAYLDNVAVRLSP